MLKRKCTAIKDLPGMFESVNKDMHTYLDSTGKDDRRPLGKLNVWAWWLEITRGCNLRCWHCATRLFKPGQYSFMSMETWRAFLQLVKEVAPRSRIEFGNAGEPTLNPNILPMLREGRKVLPEAQFMTYTNGTMLINGKLTYMQLFDAGLNYIFVDMYSPYEQHRKLAEDSGYFWYYREEKPRGAPNIFAYNGKPEDACIMLADSPENWPSRKKNQVGLSTYFNNLDWKEAEKHGLTPTTRSINRRCDTPFKYASINWDGTYCFCCFDFMRYTAGKLGSVQQGVEGFIDFWLGEYMQDCRKKVYEKRRCDHEYCKLCDFTSVRCDMPWWGGPINYEKKMAALLSQYWDGKHWQALP